MVDIHSLTPLSAGWWIFTHSPRFQRDEFDNPFSLQHCFVKNVSHSYLRHSTGLILAALKDCQVMVTSEIRTAPPPARAKVHQEMEV